MLREQNSFEVGLFTIRPTLHFALRTWFLADRNSRTRSTSSVPIQYWLSCGITKDHHNLNERCSNNESLTASTWCPSARIIHLSNLPRPRPTSQKLIQSRHRRLNYFNVMFNKTSLEDFGRQPSSVNGKSYSVEYPVRRLLTSNSFHLWPWINHVNGGLQCRSSAEEGLTPYFDSSSCSIWWAIYVWMELFKL